jgi:hypothetical protein
MPTTRGRVMSFKTLPRNDLFPRRDGRLLTQRLGAVHYLVQHARMPRLSVHF